MEIIFCNWFSKQCKSAVADYNVKVKYIKTVRRISKNDAKKIMDKCIMTSKNYSIKSMKIVPSLSLYNYDIEKYFFN